MALRFYRTKVQSCLDNSLMKEGRKCRSSQTVMSSWSGGDCTVWFPAWWSWGGGLLVLVSPARTIDDVLLPLYVKASRCLQVTGALTFTRIIDKHIKAFIICLTLRRRSILTGLAHKSVRHCHFLFFGGWGEHFSSFSHISTTYLASGSNYWSCKLFHIG